MALPQDRVLQASRFLTPGGAVVPSIRGSTPELGDPPMLRSLPAEVHPQHFMSAGSPMALEPGALLAPSYSPFYFPAGDCGCMGGGCDCHGAMGGAVAGRIGAPLFALRDGVGLFPLSPATPTIPIAGYSGLRFAVLPPQWPPVGPVRPRNPPSKPFPPSPQPPLYKPGTGQPPPPPLFDNPKFYDQILERIPPPPPRCEAKVELLDATTELIKWKKLYWTAWISTTGPILVDPITRSGTFGWEAWVDVYNCQLTRFMLHFRLYYDGTNCPPDVYYSAAAGSTPESCTYLRTDDISGSKFAPMLPGGNSVKVEFTSSDVEAELREAYGNDADIHERRGIIKKK